MLGFSTKICPHVRQGPWCGEPSSRLFHDFVCQDKKWFFLKKHVRRSLMSYQTEDWLNVVPQLPRRFVMWRPSDLLSNHERFWRGDRTGSLLRFRCLRRIFIKQVNRSLYWRCREYIPDGGIGGSRPSTKPRRKGSERSGVFCFSIYILPGWGSPVWESPTSDLLSSYP